MYDRAANPEPEKKDQAAPAEPQPANDTPAARRSSLTMATDRSDGCAAQ